VWSFCCSIHFKEAVMSKSLAMLIIAFAAMQAWHVRAEEPPVANAGPDQTVAPGADCTASVTLDGTASTDPDGDALTFTWTGDFTGGTASGATPTVTVGVGTHTITLTVDDGQGGTATDTVDVTV